MVAGGIGGPAIRAVRRYLRSISSASYKGTLGANGGPMRAKIRSAGRGRGPRLSLIIASMAIFPALSGCSSSSSSVDTGSLRQSYVDFLDAFRDPPTSEQAAASPAPNSPAVAAGRGPQRSSKPVTVAAAAPPPSDPQPGRPVPPSYYTPSAPPYAAVPSQAGTAAPSGSVAAAAPSAPPTNPDPAASAHPYALQSFLDLFRKSDAQ
jgi:hypothetical protein